jgi:hypothetical protein
MDMPYRFRDVVGGLEHSELVKIKSDLDSGGLHIRKLIEGEIRKSEAAHEKICSVCHNKIDPEDTNNFTLVFGPESFKKKASFCAIDCMEYFLNNLKKIREAR